MQKKQLILVWVMLAWLVVCACGCALIATAASAGIAYGISQAFKK